MRRRQAGVSYVEALLAVVILAIGLVPALDSLETAFTGSEIQEELLREQQQIAGRMEEVAAEPFASLDEAAQAAGSETVASSYSDAPGPGRVLVFLGRYDGDNADADDNPFTGADEGLIWVRVTVEDTARELTTLVTR